MSSVSVIPLVAKPQTLSISLSGTIYTLRVSWCRPGQMWVLDIGDANGNPLANGLPLVTGADLLEQYKYLGIPGQLIVQTSHNNDAVPTFTNLGQDGQLYYVTP